MAGYRLNSFLALLPSFTPTADSIIRGIFLTYFGSCSVLLVVFLVGTRGLNVAEVVYFLFLVGFGRFVVVVLLVVVVVFLVVVVHVVGLLVVVLVVVRTVVLFMNGFWLETVPILNLGFCRLDTTVGKNGLDVVDAILAGRIEGGVKTFDLGGGGNLFPEANLL